MLNQLVKLFQQTNYFYNTNQKMNGCEKNIHNPNRDPMNCRVNKPDHCENVSLNKWERQAFEVDKYKDIRYYHHGMQIYRPDEGLRLPQKRPFLTPEYYDQGCFEWYCPQKRLCPTGTFAGPTPIEEKMLNENFASIDWAVKNGGPASCVGIKGISENSYLGWAIPPGQQQPLWMLQDEDKQQ